MKSDLVLVAGILALVIIGITSAYILPDPSKILWAIVGILGVVLGAPAVIHAIAETKKRTGHGNN